MSTIYRTLEGEPLPIGVVGDLLVRGDHVVMVSDGREWRVVGEDLFDNPFEDMEEFLKEAASAPILNLFGDLVDISSPRERDRQEVAREILDILEFKREAAHCGY